MDLWAKLENLTRSMEIIHEKNKRLSPEKPNVKLASIKENMFKEGVTYPQVCYIIDVANGLSVPHSLRRDDFYGGISMSRQMTVARLLDTVIDRVDEFMKENQK